MPNDVSRARRAAWITGASSGIGAACLEVFAAAGWDVFGIARRKEKLEAAVRAVQDAHPSVAIVARPCDVNRESDVSAAASEIENRWGRLDALINNAGFGCYGAFSETDEARFRAVMETNFHGVLRCTRAALPLLRRAASVRPGRWGAAIVMVSSFAGRRGLPAMSAYCASKFALEGFSESLRVELRSERLSVSVINPGVTRTEFFEAAEGRRPPGYLAPEGGMRPAQVARAVFAAVRRPRRNVYLSAAGRMGIAAQRFVPGLLDFVLDRRWRRQPGV